MATDLSLLTPLQITATANLLQNQGLGVNAAFTTAVNSYSALPFIGPLISTIAASSTLTAGNKAALYTLGSSSCPALGDSVPTAGLTNFPSVLMGNLLTTTAATYMGNGDLTKFVQGFSSIQGYSGLTNIFVNSAVNSQNYLGNTFTNTNNMISGDITSVNLCTAVWAGDLTNLGVLINLNNLDELGTPLALVKQLASVGGIVPAIALSFSALGVSLDTVINLNDPTVTASDADQKAMYTAMTQISGDLLAQVLRLLGVRTANINTMADLLNPYKIFPNSFQSLTVTNKNGVSEKIYTNASGTVNSNLAQTLPAYATSSMS